MADANPDNADNADNATRLILLPGLAADGRMFDGLAAALDCAHSAGSCSDGPRGPEHALRIEVPRWPSIAGRPTLVEFAQRLTMQLQERYGTLEGTIIGGASFGGMVALEMAKALGPSGVRGVVLIGSCRGPSAVPGPLRWAERLSRPVPLALLEWGKILAPIGRPILSPVGGNNHTLLMAMLRDAPMAFVAWAARAILEWPGCPDPGVPVLHIHGRRDRILPATRVAAQGRVDLWIEQAGHLPSMEAPAAVAAEMAKWSNCQIAK